jgi:hypothetical protein
MYLDFECAVPYILIYMCVCVDSVVGNDLMQYLGLTCRPRWEDNIRMDLRKT